MSAAPAPESRHRSCWYGRRTSELPADIGLHSIEDGQLLYCVHPMWFPIVRYQFDVRSCETCEFFRPVPSERSESTGSV